MPPITLASAGQTPYGWFMRLLADLVQAGHLTRAQAQWVEDQARLTRRSVEDVLLVHGLASEDSLKGFGVDLAGQTRRIREAQDRSARMLQAIFELCVQSGIVTHEEFLERLAQTDDDPPSP